MWKGPFSDFPREYGCPFRVGILKSPSELISKLNIHNCRTTFFTSLYSFSELNPAGNRGNYGSANLNKIYLESDKGSVEPIKLLHNYCRQRKLLHCFFFSGRGFHFYIGTSGDVKNKKGTVTNSQLSICNDLGLKPGVDSESDIDSHVIGNLAQMVRVPNSFNLKRKCYCIPLRVSDLSKTVEEIKLKAKKPCPGIPIYGKDFFDLTPFDSEPITKDYDIKVDIPDGSVNVDSINVDKFPNCIKFLLNQHDIKHKERFILISYLRDSGLPLSVTVELLRKYMPYKIFRHCVLEEKQVYFIYKRTDLKFPCCKSLMKEGLCKNAENCRGPEL